MSALVWHTTQDLGGGGIVLCGDDDANYVCTREAFVTQTDQCPKCAAKLAGVRLANAAAPAANRRQARYLKLREQFAQAEADLLRATRKWDKLRGQLRRAERALDKEFNERSSIGGQADQRELAALASQIRDPDDSLVIGQCGQCYGINRHEPNCPRHGARRRE